MVHKLVNDPLDNGRFFGKVVEYSSVPETEMPDLTPHKLIVKGLPNEKQLISPLKVYFENVCGVSPVSIEMNVDEEMEVRFADSRGQLLYAFSVALAIVLEASFIVIA